MVVVSVELDDETVARLDSVSAQCGKSKSLLICEAIEKYLDRLEWEYSILSQVEAVKNGSMKTYTLDEICAKYDLDGYDIDAVIEDGRLADIPAEVKTIIGLDD